MQPALSLIAPLLLLAGCTGDSFNGGLRTDAPRARLIPAPNPARQQFITVTDSPKTAADGPVKRGHIGIGKAWDAVGPWPQFISYEVEIYAEIGKTPTIVTTTNLFYYVTSGVAPQKFIGRVRARDTALPNPSEWAK